MMNAIKDKLKMLMYHTQAINIFSSAVFPSYFPCIICHCVIFVKITTSIFKLMSLACHVNVGKRHQYI